MLMASPSEIVDDLNCTSPEIDWAAIAARKS